MLQRFSIALMFVVLVASASAATIPTPAAPIIGAKSFLLIDSKTGHEIAALDADVPLAPASLTKLMTTYVVFDALKQNQISLDQDVTISEKAWRTPGSTLLGVNAGFIARVGRSPSGASKPIAVTSTRLVPSRIISSFSAATYDRSIIRLLTKGPRSLTRTMMLLLLRRFRTLT